MTTLKDIDDALQAFEQARIFAFAQLGNAYDLLAQLNIELADASTARRIVEPIHYSQEEDKGGFEISDGQFGVLVDMNGFSLHDLAGDGEIDEQRPREDTLRVLCAYILSEDRPHLNNELREEANALNVLLGPVDKPLDSCARTTQSTIAHCDWDSYADDVTFLEFLDREVNDMIPYALVEDLALFAFGGMEEAVAAYDTYQAASADESTDEDKA